MEFNATFLITIISFVLFVFIMNAIFYAPIIKIMEKRKAFIKQNQQETENAKLETSVIQNKKSQKIAEAKASAKEAVDKETKILKESVKKITDEFSEIQKNISENKKVKLTEEAEIAQNQLYRDAENVADIISEKITGGTNA